MQTANTLFASVHLQRNKQAFFIAFSFEKPEKTTVQQRRAHYVATVPNKDATSEQIMEIVYAQALRDKAADFVMCNTESMEKLLYKNDCKVN